MMTLFVAAWLASTGAAAASAPTPPRDCEGATVFGAIAGGAVGAGSAVAITFALADVAQKHGDCFAGSCDAPRLGAFFASPFAAVGGAAFGVGLGAAISLGVCSWHEG